MLKNVFVFFVIGLPQAQKILFLLDFILFVLTQAQRIMISLVFGFYSNLVTRIKPIIPYLIKLKIVFFTLWARVFKTLPHYFQRVSCMMLQVLIFRFPIIHSLLHSRYTFPSTSAVSAADHDVPTCHIHKKRNHTAGEILTPYLPSPQLESGVTNAVGTSGVVSLTSNKVTWPYHHSLALHTIPPVEISTKSPKVGKLHPRSPPPPGLPWSNQSCKH
jgi:hypothetical protein